MAPATHRSCLNAPLLFGVGCRWVVVCWAHYHLGALVACQDRRNRPGGDVLQGGASVPAFSTSLYTYILTFPLPCVLTFYAINIAFSMVVRHSFSLYPGAHLKPPFLPTTRILYPKTTRGPSLLQTGNDAGVFLYTGRRAFHILYLLLRHYHGGDFLPTVAGRVFATLYTRGKPRG